MGIKFTSLKDKVATIIFLPPALILYLGRFFLSRLRLSLFHQTNKVIAILAENQSPQHQRARVLAVITHIAAFEETKDAEKALPKTEKLTRTIEGLLSSFAHCELQIVINTIADRHVIPYLPEYQRNLIDIREQSNCEPLLVGFMAQEEFINRLAEFDWFLFTEDDIVLYDSCLLEKLKSFNKASENNRAVLLPNRYEMWQGIKTYIDVVGLKWNKLSILEIENMKFAECQGAHSGFYCLSESQMQIWIESGRFWKNKVTYAGPLESAATGCLFECFSIYKPHFANLHFFEVQHWDTKYSKAIHQSLSSNCQE